VLWRRSLKAAGAAPLGAPQADLMPILSWRTNGILPCSAAAGSFKRLLDRTLSETQTHNRESRGKTNRDARLDDVPPPRFLDDSRTDLGIRELGYQSVRHQEDRQQSWKDEPAPHPRHDMADRPKGQEDEPYRAEAPFLVHHLEHKIEYWHFDQGRVAV